MIKVIELPDDDDRKQGGAFVGRLNKAMYGFVQAAKCFYIKIKEELMKIGFLVITLIHLCRSTINTYILI